MFILTKFDTLLMCFVGSSYVFLCVLSVCVSVYSRCCLFLGLLYCILETFYCFGSNLQERWKFIAERQDEWKLWMIDDEIFFSSQFIYSHFSIKHQCGCLPVIYMYSYSVYVCYKLIKFTHECIKLWKL